VFPHVLPEDADAAIGNFCRHTGDIVFSSMPVPDRSARRHVNFSTPGHYAAAFAGYGFYRDSSFDASVVTPWAVRFRRASPQETIGVYEDRLWSESAQRQELERRLTETESRVANMERSWFWRMRTPWAKITGR
jgi:hypothetical protein